MDMSMESLCHHCKSIPFLLIWVFPDILVLVAFCLHPLWCARTVRGSWVGETHCRAHTLPLLLPDRGHAVTRQSKFYGSVKQCLRQIPTGKIRDSRTPLQILEGIAKKLVLFLGSVSYGFKEKAK